MNMRYEEERKKLQERIKRQEKKIMEKLEELEKDGCPISIKGIKTLKDKKNSHRGKGGEG